MGIVVRAACKNCDRTSSLMPDDFNYCYKCKNDPEHMRKVMRNKDVQFIASSIIFILWVLFSWIFFKFIYGVK